MLNFFFFFFFKEAFAHFLPHLCLNWPLKTLEILIDLPSPEVGFSVYNLMQEECQKRCFLPLQKMIPIILEFL